MKVINKYSFGIVLAFSDFEISVLANALTSYVRDKNKKAPLWNDTYKLNDFLLNNEVLKKNGKRRN